MLTRLNTFVHADTIDIARKMTIEQNQLPHLNHGHCHDDEVCPKPDQPEQ